MLKLQASVALLLALTLTGCDNSRRASSDSSTSIDQPKDSTVADTSAQKNQPPPQNKLPDVEKIESHAKTMNPGNSAGGGTLPDSAEAVALKKAILVDIVRRNYKDLLENSNKLIASGHGDSEAYVIRSRVYDKLGRPSDAFKDLNEALKLDPKNAIAYSQRAGVYLEMHKVKQALADANESIKLDPGQSDFYRQRADVYSIIGDKVRKKADEDKATQVSRQ